MLRAVFPASFVLVIAVCVVHWAEFSLRDTGFYDPSVRHKQLHHLSKRRGGVCERGMWREWMVDSSVSHWE